MEVQHRIEEQISRHATALKQQVPAYLLMKTRTVVSFMGVESKHFQNIQTLCVSMNAASSTASISIWKERWEWISVNPADLFMCTLSTKDN
jgi:hypothetical protein